MHASKPFTPSPWVDPDDAPELTEEMLQTADIYHGNKLIRPGRPDLDAPTETITLRIDADVLDAFRETGPGWQARVSDTLRAALNLPKRA